MEEAQKYRDQFLGTVNEIEMNLSFILEDWEGYLKDEEGLEDLYRMVHSLKSGAAFLDLSAIEESSHQLEDDILAYRRGERSAGDLKNQVARLLDRLDIPAAPSEPDRFTPLERSRFEEARIRQESLYRLTCVIDPSETMKKARAFLIQNNLEISFNVIKAVPDLNREADFSVFTVYLSTPERKDAIRKAVDVDRIGEVRIESFSLNDDDPPAEQEILITAGRSKRHPVNVELDRLDEVRLYLKKLMESRPEPSGEAARLIAGMDRVMENLLFEPFYEMGRGMDLYLAKLCDRAGKKVELSIRGDNVSLPLIHIQHLNEIFRQLIRNSLTHGIESRGRITITGEVRQNRPVLIYADDGKGIDEKKIRRLADDQTTPLLELLCSSGLSTAPRADYMAGRGMGLNIVKHNVEQMGGTLNLDTEAQGARFILELPSEQTVSLLQYRVGAHVATLPLSFVAEELPLDHKLLKRNRRNQYFYRRGQDHLRLYELDKPVNNLDAMRRARFVIIVNYLMQEYALLADELLLERSATWEEVENMLYINPAHLEKGRT